MALMGEEQPLAAGVAAVTAPENGRDAAPSIDRSLRSTSQEQLHQQPQASGEGSLLGLPSVVSSKAEKITASPEKSVPPVAPGIPVPPQTLPTKRTARELLETRNTPSKMEIGQGVLLLADISGAELVVIRGLFQGKIKAQCIDVEQGAEVEGTIECEAARIDGKFDGVFVSTHSLHLASHANVSGKIIYRRLKVAKGAQLYGHSEYRSPVLPK